MMKRGALTIAAVAMMAVSACSSGSSGGTTAPPTTSAAAKPANGAPSVSNPIDVNQWQSKMCDLVPKSKLSSYGDKPDEAAARPETVHGEKACAWSFDGSAIGWSFQTFHGQGISQIYAMKGDTDKFAPYTEAGYPAVAASHKGTMENGWCDAFVAVRNDTVLDVNEQASSGAYEKDPCTGAKIIAKAAMETITGK